MSAAAWLGILLSLAAGVVAGNCMLPMKFARRWAWENTWLVFTVVSLLVLPWAMAFAGVNNLLGVYAAVPAGSYAAPLLFGFGWGIAQVLFGLSIARLGLALGYAIIIGLGALLGTLVPLFFQQRQVLATAGGAVVLAGVAVMVAGIAVSSRAGRLRESALAGGARSRESYGAALLIAVICGLLAPMVNYSFAFGQGLAEEAVRQGTPPARAGYAVWPVGLTGGLVPNLAYSIYLLGHNRTWGLFRARPLDAWSGTAMGVLWMGAMALYGIASVFLGPLGTSTGWALFQIFMIMTANLSGILTGEWRGAPRAAARLLRLGLLLLAAATVAISVGNRLSAGS
jgi:L-rhamnose-H+ transport protein